MKLFFSVIPLLFALIISISACHQQTSSIKRDVSIQDQAEDLSAQLKELYDPVLESVGLTPEDYVYYANFWFDGLFSENEIMGLHQILSLTMGDTSPVFYWDQSNEVLYAVTMNRQEEFYLYTLSKNPNPNPDDTDFSRLWLQAEDMKTISK